MSKETKPTAVNNTEATQRLNNEATYTQDEFLELKMMEMLEKKMEQLEANEVNLGVKVIKLSPVEGKPKLDKDGNVVILNHETGEVDKWGTTYYATLSFNGGELQQKVTSEQYQDLILDKRYLAKGRLVMVTPDKGFPYLKPEFAQFFKLL